jgi:hypothetical protein
MAVAAALVCMGGCARSDGAREGAVAQALAAADPAELRVTSGTLAKVSATSFRVEHPSFRAELGDVPRASAEIAFVYRGPTRQDAPLASGEMRRQIGLKLRALDTCNVVYVMWHIEPTRGIEVSVKSNPGLHTHDECGDRGYTFVHPSWVSAALSPVDVGAQHVLSAAVAGDTLRVTADGKLAWTGPIPRQAFAFDGPVGVRSDNGIFDAELRVSAAAEATDR